MSAFILPSLIIDYDSVARLNPENYCYGALQHECFGQATRGFALIGIASITIGCGADKIPSSPTDPELALSERPRTSIAPSIVGNGVSDGTTEFYVDSV